MQYLLHLQRGSYTQKIYHMPGPQPSICLNYSNPTYTAVHTLYFLFQIFFSVLNFNSKSTPAPRLAQLEPFHFPPRGRYNNTPVRHPARRIKAFETFKRFYQLFFLSDCNLYMQSTNIESTGDAIACGSKQVSLFCQRPAIP